MLLFSWFACLCCIVNADEGHSFNLREKYFWETLYSGNFSLGHKLILSRPVSGLNDEILNKFMLSYLCYKSGNANNILNTFEEVDLYLREFLLNED